MEVVHHNIPIDIIRKILLKLEIKSVIRCECVCKEWRSIIQDPDFKLSYDGSKRVIVVAQSSKSCLALTSITNTTTPLIETLFRRDTRGSTTFPPLNRWWSGVWCSCNGLVLFSLREHILLWNPTTRCCTKVLELQRLLSSWDVLDLVEGLCYDVPSLGRNDVVSGLCYVPSTGDYKAVVCFLCDRTSVFVASLKSKEWRKVLFPYNTESIRDDGVNFHNTLHWRVGDLQTGLDKIVYFDPESDEFKEMSIPVPEGESSVILGMGIIDECLCVALELERGGSIQVLVMKEYGVEKSWVTGFNISTIYLDCEKFSSDYINATLYSSKCNAKVLMICRNISSSWEILVHDLKNNTLKPTFFTESSVYWGFIGICSYVQSTVSPREFIWRYNDDQHNPPAQNDDALLRFILGRFNI
ncbi:PREDICTED: F-box/kelch-repeat protein At3g23880-like [Ipomoea nil]|uniref:F-box/kelch-repeat protein At3g23880-like n=1 Tax=Ipomoea nil TaxID=35883 RepID=UPI000901A1F4|nr:PREDICTED: F-box/kelch-repeat protein At3g23880-like [Ipomoea nil]